MEEYIHDENLKIFRRQLELAKDDARRQLLLRLLAEEEAKVPVRDQIGDHRRTAKGPSMRGVS
jgi:hypothetical protein